MKEIYSNKIFNWTLVIISILRLIGSSYLLTEEFNFFNTLFERIFLFVISILSILSFFIKKMNNEFYSRFFIVATLISPYLSIYYHFVSDKLFHSIPSTYFIYTITQAPISHFIFLFGIIMLFLSIKFSKKTIKQRESEYGIMIMIYSLYVIILCFIDYFQILLSIKFVGIRLLLSLGILLIGNRLRLEKIRFINAIILVLILDLMNKLIIWLPIW